MSWLAFYRDANLCIDLCFSAHHTEMLGYKIAKAAAVTKGKKREALVWIEGRSEKIEENVPFFKRNPPSTLAPPLTTSLGLQCSLPKPHLIEPSLVPIAVGVRPLLHHSSTPAVVSISSARLQETCPDL